MQCDVRECPEDEVIPLFNKMIKGNKPSKIVWDGNYIYLTYKRLGQEFRVILRAYKHTFFEFYTGIDNIRFDGTCDDPAILSILNDHIIHGKGRKVSDFIKL